MNISVLGCGRWGTFIAWYLYKVKHNVILWGRESSSKLNELKETRKNKFVELPATIELTSSLEKVFNSRECIVIAIEAQNLRDLMEQIKKYNFKDKIYVLCMKGLDDETGQRLSEVMETYIGNKENLAIWVGPGHPKEYVKGNSNCMVIDSENDELKRKLAKEFSSDLIKFYYGNDLIGNEIGAALKNVIGIAGGMLDGLNLTCLKGALMARGTREISRLVKKMGGNEITPYGLCCLGDYEASMFSEFSNSRRFGEAFVKKEEFKEHTPGKYTVKSLMKLIKRYDIELPICETIYKIIYENKDALSGLKELFNIEIKEEF